MACSNQPLHRTKCSGKTINWRVLVSCYLYFHFGRWYHCRVGLLLKTCSSLVVVVVVLKTVMMCGRTSYHLPRETVDTGHLKHDCVLFIITFCYKSVRLSLQVYLHLISVKCLCCQYFVNNITCAINILIRNSQTRKSICISSEHLYILTVAIQYGKRSCSVVQPNRHFAHRRTFWRPCLIIFI